MRVHLFPSRTQKLSSFAPTILCGRLHGKIGNANIKNLLERVGSFLFLLHTYRAGTRPRRMSELPTAYKYVRLYRLPLTRTAGTCPRPTGAISIYVDRYCIWTARYNPVKCELLRKRCVIYFLAHLCRAGTRPRRCRNYRLRTNLFAPTVCRCADGTPRSSCPTTVERTAP